jgi:hypothetical protein
MCFYILSKEKIISFVLSRMHLRKNIIWKSTFNVCCNYFKHYERIVETNFYHATKFPVFDMERCNEIFFSRFFLEQIFYVSRIHRLSVIRRFLSRNKVYWSISVTWLGLVKFTNHLSLWRMLLHFKTLTFMKWNLFRWF